MHTWHAVNHSMGMMQGRYLHKVLWLTVCMTVSMSVPFCILCMHRLFLYIYLYMSVIHRRNRCTEQVHWHMFYNCVIWSIKEKNQVNNRWRAGSSDRLWVWFLHSVWWKAIKIKIKHFSLCCLDHFLSLFQWQVTKQSSQGAVALCHHRGNIKQFHLSFCLQTMPVIVLQQKRTHLCCTSTWSWPLLCSLQWSTG